ncbi:MAG TPA: HEAT repeat domain-containing protein [Vicinamibacterales bacterium]|nr:HEAT repeat domain-containing protein [Vicinamibacterales bacterium]
MRRLMMAAALGVLLAASPASSASSASSAGAQHTFEEVAAGLRAPDPDTRLRAVQILKDGGLAEAAGPLSAAVNDPDARVQLAAIDAERSLFITKPIARKRMIGFVVEVRNNDVGEQVFAAGQLALVARVVPPEVLSALAEAMHSSNPRVRLDALYVFGALAPLGRPAAPGTAASPAAPATAASEDAIRSGISWTIEALRRGNRAEQTAAAEVAGRALKDCGSPVAGELCVEMGNALVDAVNNRDAQVHRAAMVSLGQLRYPNAVQALADQLSYYQNGPDAHAALEGLAGIGHPTSADIFKRLLASGDPDFRRLAVEGLARAGSAADLPDVQRMAQTEKSNPVLLALHYAALKLGAPGAKPDQLIASLRDPSLRPLALQYLLDLSPAIAPALASHLQDPDPETRMLVADVLGFSRDAAIVPRLEAATKDPDMETARAARRAIDRINLR